MLTSIALGTAVEPRAAQQAPIQPGLIVINTDENGFVPNGIIWESESFVGSKDFSNLVSYLDRAIFVVTPDAGGGFLDKSSYMQLPIKISNTGLYITLLGKVSATWGNGSDVWLARTYPEGKTKKDPDLFNYHHLLYVASDNYSKTGQIDYNVRVVMYCTNEKCKVPAKSMALQPINLRLHSGRVSTNDTIPIMASASAKAKFVFNTSCRFTLQNDNFKDLLVSKAKTANTLLPVTNQGDFSTTFSASCTGSPKAKVNAQKDESTYLYVTLWPALGNAAGQPTLAATTQPGIGIVYTLGARPTSCAGNNFGEKQLLGQLLKYAEKDWRAEAKVYWGICQYETPDKVPSGSFSSTINYKLWLE